MTILSLEQRVTSQRDNGRFDSLAGILARGGNGLFSIVLPIVGGYLDGKSSSPPVFHYEVAATAGVLQGAYETFNTRSSRYIC